jgi:hypothetical protein
MRKWLAGRLSGCLLKYSIQTNYDAPTQIDRGGLDEDDQTDQHIDDPYQRPQSGDDDFSDPLANAATQDAPLSRSRF